MAKGFGFFGMLPFLINNDGRMTNMARRKKKER
jgi:hypothetical protein